jgi:hypothetical protein
VVVGCAQGTRAGQRRSQKKWRAGGDGWLWRSGWEAYVSGHSAGAGELTYALRASREVDILSVVDMLGNAERLVM